MNEMIWQHPMAPVGNISAGASPLDEQSATRTQGAIPRYQLCDAGVHAEVQACRTKAKAL